MGKEACLNRGSTYVVGKKTFRQGVWKAVSPEEEARLREFAVDPVTVTDGDTSQLEHRQKFSFRDTSDNATPPAPKAPEEAPQGGGDGGGPKQGKKAGKKGPGKKWGKKAPGKQAPEGGGPTKVR